MVNSGDEGKHVQSVGVMKEMDLGTDFSKELENYRKRCHDLEEKSKEDEMRCLMLEIEVGDLKKKNEELQWMITKIQKVASNEEKGKDEENKGDEFVQLMIENKVLELEKKVAESELLFWKEKVKELVRMNTSVMNESSMRIKDEEVKVTMKTHFERDNEVLIDEEKVKEDSNVVSAKKSSKIHSQVRKRLPFEEDGCSNKKMAPSTPGVGQPPFSDVIDISDEDDNCNKSPQVKNISKNDLKKTNQEHSNEDDVDGFERHFRIVASAKRRRASNIMKSDDDESNKEEDIDGFKRKRAAKIVTSDEETSYDDDAPICTLMKQCNSKLKTDSEDEVKEDTNVRHLTRLRRSGSKSREKRSTFDLNKTVCLHGNSSSEDEEDDDGVEEGSESEGESLGGFIVDSSESGDSCDESEDVLNEYMETLDKIRRKPALNLKWDLEGDMLADFGKDPELCMRAVCAIYRQQTADEKASKGTIHRNDRGFSQYDAFRASKMAEFLMDGDSRGDMKKTVEKLKRYDSKGIKLCMTLATRYSKQLFAIYQNKEDPYFLP